MGNESNPTLAAFIGAVIAIVFYVLNQVLGISIDSVIASAATTVGVVAIQYFAPSDFLKLFSK